MQYSRSVCRSEVWSAVLHTQNRARRIANNRVSIGSKAPERLVDTAASDHEQVTILLESDRADGLGHVAAFQEHLHIGPNLLLHCCDLIATRLKQVLTKL